MIIKWPGIWFHVADDWDKDGKLEMFETPVDDTEPAYSDEMAMLWFDRQEVTALRDHLTELLAETASGTIPVVPDNSLNKRRRKRGIAI
jgi:hypothetical protein